MVASGLTNNQVENYPEKWWDQQIDQDWPWRLVTPGKMRCWLCWSTFITSVTWHQSCHGFARSSEGRGLGGLAVDLIDSRCFFYQWLRCFVKELLRSCWSCLCVFCRKSMVFYPWFLYVSISRDIYIYKCFTANVPSTGIAARKI